MIPDFDRIAAAFLVKDKKLFIAQRSENDEQALKWELPGGKLNDEENYDDALIREFNEEFGAQINVVQEIGSAEVNYKGKVLIVMFFLIETDPAKINLKIHKDSKFVSFNELKSIDLCEADKVFINNYEDDIKKYID